jgi:putative ABC transport system permease protein
LHSLLHDLRFALRTLGKNRSFAAVAILTLALGIGATTAIFSVVYGVLLRPLPYDHPDQLVRVWEADAKGHRMGFADPNFEDVRDQNRSLQGIAEYTSFLQSVSGGQQPTRTMVALVSHDFFNVLRVQPIRGRSFTPEEHRAGASAVALVRYGYWKQYLGGNTDLASFRLTIDNRPVSVVGVLPAGFNFPEASEIWVPRESSAERYPSRTAHNWRSLARLRDGVSLAQATADLSAIGARIKQQFGDNVDVSAVALMPLQESLTGSVRPVLLLLLGAVAFLLLIACANVANLMLAQGAARARELAIRTALGAERGRLVRQFLTEALLLSVIAGAVGVLAAAWGVNALLALGSNPLPNAQDVSVNTPVLLFALATCCAVAVLLGVLCALRATRGDLQGTLAEGHRQAGSARGNRLGRLIVTAQLAAALILLVGAGLLARSLFRVLSTDPGFHTERVLTVNLALPNVEALQSFGGSDAAKARRVAFLDSLLGRLRALPGVERAGAVDSLPLTSGNADGTYALMSPGEAAPQTMEDFQRLFASKERTGVADYCVAGDGYFETLGIPLVRGRLFDLRDTAAAPRVALISQSLAREKWPNQDPIGRLIEFGNMDGDTALLTVVGVVGDIHYESLEQRPNPTIYVNYHQRPQRATSFNVMLRTNGDPALLVRPALEVVRELDPTIPPKLATFSQVFSASLESRRFGLTLMAAFSATALVLAIAGIYGVISYSVTRRTREFGVRMALGANSQDVLTLVLGEGMRPVLLGIVLGIGGGLALGRTIQSLLFNVSSTDPLTFAAVAVLLVLVAVLACLIPARRATRVDPLVALRYE